MNKCRGQAVKRFREVMPGLLKIDAEKFDVKFDRSGLAEFQSLLKDDLTSDRYELFPPILYPEHDFKRLKVFGNPIFPQVIISPSLFIHVANYFHSYSEHGYSEQRHFEMGSLGHHPRPTGSDGRSHLLPQVPLHSRVFWYMSSS